MLSSSSSVSDSSTFMMMENKVSDMNSSNKLISDLSNSPATTTSSNLTMGIIPDYDDDICIDGDEDIIMQFEEDEGLLPDIWNQKSNEYEQSSFYTSNTMMMTTTTSNVFSSSPNTSRISTTQFSNDVAVLSSDESSIDDDSHSHHSEDSSDSFFSSTEENNNCRSFKKSSVAPFSSPASSSPFAESNFYERLETLHDSMKRSYQTRHALFYSDFRSRQTDEVLMRAEYSTYQVDCYVRGYLMNQHQHQQYQPQTQHQNNV